MAAVLLVGLSVGVFVASRDFPSGFGDSPGAAFFPRLIVSIITLLAGVLFVWSVVSSETRTYDVSATDVRRFAVPVTLLVMYVALMPILGFVIDTVAFLVVLTLYSGVKSYWRSGALAVGLSLALHYVFGEFLHIPLPEGSLVSVVRWLPSLPLAGVV
ncbi:tripartite tricarboxylate transporter TctB family protein [Halorussus salinisoli]|uniref:tripartite tricarboxylate transporter TctB family protein n=1 Tax=Halorussus salinisoli TaxID=2558242 RepID=UPI0014857ABD|nr:tripartite tricarboxylate transporter TctB family protein [Halorussus salinisoli]